MLHFEGQGYWLLSFGGCTVGGSGCWDRENTA